MNKVYRIFVKKKSAYAVEAQNIKRNLIEQLRIKDIRKLEIANRYDVEGIDEETLKKAIPTILSEPMVDDVFRDNYPTDKERLLAIEYLPGQYDQRADSTVQCFNILTGKQNIKIKCAKLVIITGNISDNDFKKTATYLINPIDSRIANLDICKDLSDTVLDIPGVPIIDHFINFTKDELKQFIDEYALAMNLDDLLMTQTYFKQLKRNPTETEIKVLDTYWSDHCRHTTFKTIINDVRFNNGPFKHIIENDYKLYLKIRSEIYSQNNKPITLMDLATISVKEMLKKGLLPDLEVSEEINACSIRIDVETNKGIEKWLLMFKNETHNHPTEIEPFGGAATCLGGAIRDPLSGRAYVYQAMRISGSGDPRKPIADTIEGKLPQIKITKEAARGYSSYGNQIGLATGFVNEIYDEGYVAKRMELGAVIAAAPENQVKRLEPSTGDIVLLIGGKTGRDGCGGATGSSKAHDTLSNERCGAEVQKGNPIEERKIQRLFRRGEVSEKIIRCNDFGAGGVSVAVGEIASSLDINLDAILKKYEGLTGTELAISESQERMAVVIKKEDEEFITEACRDENIEVVRVATVTDTNKLVMTFQGQKIVDIDRDFLDASGAKRYQAVDIELPSFKHHPFQKRKIKDFKKEVKKILTSLNVCSQKGLVEMFDSSIGSNTVLSPYGGKYYGTPSEGMVALIPILNNETMTSSVMTYGYNSTIARWSPYHGAIYAIIESIAKVVAIGADYKKIRFSFQEYFERLNNDTKRWGKPMSALLGALRVQEALLLPSIGGKDSMSGSYMNLDVPPTLVSFAVTTTNVQNVITPEFKEANNIVSMLEVKRDKYFIPDFEDLKQKYDYLLKLMSEKKIFSAYTIKTGGLIEAVSKMAFGNRLGFTFDNKLKMDCLNQMLYGNIIVEAKEEIEGLKRIGIITSDYVLKYKKETVKLNDAYKWYLETLADIFPTSKEAPTSEARNQDCSERSKLTHKKCINKPLVVIPVFPGTNCEYDSKRAFEKAGAKVEICIFKNKTLEDIQKSINELEVMIKKCSIMMLPGGFSAGDEPEGSGKFIATVLRNPKLKEAIMDLLNNRDGLIIGICNGFQALIKLGLLPYGEIRDLDKNDPTLTFNTIGRHVSQMVKTKISSLKSPWLDNVKIGEIYTLPVSHGEGRFVAPLNVLNDLFNNGQVITQYVDEFDKPTMISPYNPNGSMEAIEGIISKDGRVLGKMGHSERIGRNIYKNIYGEMDQRLFEAGVNYFRK